MPRNPLTLGKKAWELFLEKNVLDPQLVRGEVARSWQRCRDLNVNPFQPIIQYCDRSRQLEERLYHRENLIRIARPFMRDLYQLVSGSAFQVVLTDEEGYLLDVIGDKAIVSRSEEVHLSPGGVWSEALAGTNAIGTALAEKQPVQIFAWEHFCEQSQFLTCSASPIHDTRGNIVGVLDASGDCREANPHTIGMVVATVHAIENQLRLEEAKRQLYASSRFSSIVLNGMADGLITIDRDGIVREINARGGQILGINPLAARGRPLVEVCSANASVVDVLKSGHEFQNREITIRAGKRVQSSASWLQDENGGIVGTIAFFREIDDHRLSKRAIPSLRRHTFEEIVAESAKMRAAREWAIRAADCCSNVLILGESGTGKEMFANAIHNASSRREGPFVAINCAALPESLVESELFGYVDGSFTGARKGGQAGKFEFANGGTIFLDEVADMSPSVQAKLLRVLNDKSVSRIGSAREFEVDIRIIAATNRDLKKEVESGRFREDLYYRLAVLEITVPPLRERLEDIPLLARCLVNKLSFKFERGPLEMDPGFVRKLALCSWPGNVREMENAIERAIVRMGNERMLGAAHLSLPDEVTVIAGEPSIQVPDEQPNAASRLTTLREIERQAITEALTACTGNIKKTAVRLGIARNTLYRKMREYDLLTPDQRY